MAKEKQSLRAKHAQKRADDQRRRRRNYTLITIVAVAVVAGLIFINQPNIVVPTNSEGMGWGPLDAPVLVQEYSDFQ